MSWELIYLISSLLILPVFIIAIIISIRVTTVINHYHHYQAGGNLTARELVKMIAARENLNIAVEGTSNASGDHYDPKAKTVRLTAKVLNGTSISALAIAAHECGHAIQDARNYAPLRVRHAVIHISNFGSRLLTPLIIITLIASCFPLGAVGETWAKWLLLGFCITYGLSALVGLVTLPTEFDASRRGMKILSDLHLMDTKEEKRAVKKVLGAAANTYVISFALSLVYFLRYLSLLMMLGDRR